MNGIKQGLALGAAAFVGLMAGAGVTGYNMAEQNRVLVSASAQPAPQVAQAQPQPAKLTMWSQPQSIQPVFADGELTIYEEQNAKVVIYRDDRGGIAVTMEDEHGAFNITNQNGTLVATPAPAVFTNL